MTLGLTQNVKRKLVSAFAASLALVNASGAYGQDKDWWFEVEVILFKQNLDPSTITESFVSDLNRLDTASARDLLTPYLLPDISLLYDSLEACDVQPEPLWLTLPPVSSTQETGAEDDLLPSDAPPLSGSPHSGVEDEDLIADEVSDSALQAQINSFQEQLSPSPVHLGDQNAAAPELDSVTSEALVPDEAQQQAEAFTQLLLDWTPQDISMPAGMHCQFFPAEPLLYAPIEPLMPPERRIEKVPAAIDGTEWLYSQQPYLLPASMLQLRELAQDISRRKGLTMLSHLGWRQQVLFGRDKAQPVRLFAGENYASQFYPDGSLRPQSPSLNEPAPLDSVEQQQEDTQDLIAEIRAAINTPDWQPLQQQEQEAIPEEDTLVVTPVWELDGSMKVFLRYINRVPYLHIDNNMEFRAPVFRHVGGEQQQVLESYPFEQLRRVISTQMHYFDHPLFGVLVQIRRYYPPQKPQEAEETL